MYTVWCVHYTPQQEQCACADPPLCGSFGTHSKFYTASFSVNTITLHSPTSTLHSPPFTLHPSSSTLHSPPSTLHPPSSTLHSPPSTLLTPYHHLTQLQDYCIFCHWGKGTHTYSVIGAKVHTHILPLRQRFTHMSLGQRYTCTLMTPDFTTGVYHSSFDVHKIINIKIHVNHTSLGGLSSHIMRMHIHVHVHMYMCRMYKTIPTCICTLYQCSLQNRINQY